tara:strand:+ start:1509 stop:2417 length:909 start_codon:yes stop_codon:yes gene_type:complete
MFAKLFKGISKGISKAFKGLKKAVKGIKIKDVLKVVGTIGVALVAPALLGNMMTGLGGAMAGSSSAIVSSIGSGISSLGTFIGGTAATAGGPGFLSRTFSSVSGTISSGIQAAQDAGTMVKEFFTGPNPLKEINVTAQKRFTSLKAGKLTDPLQEIAVTAKKRTGPLAQAQQGNLFTRAVDKVKSINVQDELREEIAYRKGAAKDAVGELLVNKITGDDIRSAQENAANNPYNTLNQPNFVRGDSPYMAADNSGLAPTMNHAPTQAYIQNQNSMQNSLQQQGIMYGPTPSFIANAYHFQPIG